MASTKVRDIVPRAATQQMRTQALKHVDGVLYRYQEAWQTRQKQAEAWRQQYQQVPPTPDEALEVLPPKYRDILGPFLKRSVAGRGYNGADGVVEMLVKGGMIEVTYPSRPDKDNPVSQKEHDRANADIATMHSVVQKIWTARTEDAIVEALKELEPFIEIRMPTPAEQRKPVMLRGKPRFIGA